VHPDVVGSGCRAATTLPAFNGRNPNVRSILPPLNAALLVATSFLPEKPVKQQCELDLSSDSGVVGCPPFSRSSS
jgi:hypothetical protein